jgi:hypothetical protein
MKLREIPSKTLRVFNGTESHILNFIWPREPLRLSGKVMEWENKQNQKIPGSIPTPANLKKTSYDRD